MSQRGERDEEGNSWMLHDFIAFTQIGLATKLTM